MRKSMSRILVETVVKEALKSIKESPERGVRNLVDMALQFSEGRFQQNFFITAQTMLQNENSAYYGLVRDTVTCTDTERLFTFGMNLGYNGCTTGARHIRENEATMGCNIPWTISVQLDTLEFEKKQEKYHELIQEGEELGIYTWMLFAINEPEKALLLARIHPESAFCIFCETESLSEKFLDEASYLHNVMVVLRYEETTSNIYSVLREKGLLYSVWYQYGQKDTEFIINGDLFSSTQQYSPAFTALLPEENCPEGIRDLIYQEVIRTRNEQHFRTIVWELQHDNCLVDSIISGDDCAIYFDREGNPCDWNGKIGNGQHNLFLNSLKDILISACPKETGGTL